jgi:hypothetical protein
MGIATCPGCLERDQRIAALERRVAELEATVRDLSARLGTNATNSGTPSPAVVPGAPAQLKRENQMRLSLGCLLWTLLVGTLVVGPQEAGTRQPPKVLVRVIRAAFSLDNTRLLTAVWRGKKALALWDVQSGKELLRFWEHGQMVGFVDFTPDGNQVLAGSRDGVLRT